MGDSGKSSESRLEPGSDETGEGQCEDNASVVAPDDSKRPMESRTAGKKTQTPKSEPSKNSPSSGAVEKEVPKGGDSGDNSNSKSDQTERGVQKGGWNVCQYAVAVLVLALAFIIGAGLVFPSLNGDDEPSQQPGINPNFEYPKIYEIGLQRLQETFTHQTARFWKTLKNRGLAHLRKASPTQPLVLMIVAPPSAHSYADCFAKKLAEILDPEHKKNLSVINGKDYTSSRGDKAKEELDNILKEILQCGHRATVICNLQLLPPPSPVLFHSYCDNDNAPYKHAAILFTVQLPREPDPTLSPVQTEGLVEKYLLQEVWTDDVDAVAALLSRIADTVVVLSGEDEQNLKSVCD